ncbi:hypothetical protein [Deinococcus altitudinis]|uniref:hypothetical protein n=1 Tax=Deinococcus altitudinis TaxID=468914 RepID=UPI003891A7BF
MSLGEPWAAMSQVYATPERRSSDPLAVLSRQLNAACVQAVQPEELAAILEAEGYTDALIEARYGDQNVFACAERLFRMVPYRSPKFVWRSTTAPVQVWRDLLRGLIYLLPALWTPTALALGWSGPGGGSGNGATLGLLVATLFGWGWMQSLSYIGYTKLAESASSAAQILRQGGLIAVLATEVLAVGLAWATGQNIWQVALVATAISAYLAAATLLLVLGSEVLLLVSSVPALLWALIRLLSPELVSSGGAQQSATVLALGVSLPVLAAWHVTQLALLREKPGPARRLAAITWWRATPYAGYGWLCAAFLSLVLLRPLTQLSGVQTPVPGASELLGWSWSVAPLVLSMGVLELGLRRVHSALHRAAQSSAQVRRIVWGGVWEVLKVCFIYAAVLGAAYLLARQLAAYLGFGALPWPLIGGHLALAVTLLLSGLLINFGLIARVLVVWATGVTLQVTLLSSGLDVALSYAVSASGALLALLALMWLAIRDVRNFH